MPLLAAAMESATAEHIKSGMLLLLLHNSPFLGNEVPDLSSSEYRVLYNYLLRNESGVSINFWENDATWPLIQSFCAVSTLLLLKCKN